MRASGGGCGGGNRSPYLPSGLCEKPSNPCRAAGFPGGNLSCSPTAPTTTTTGSGGSGTAASDRGAGVCGRIDTDDVRRRKASAEHKEEAESGCRDCNRRIRARAKCRAKAKRYVAHIAACAGPNPHGGHWHSCCGLLPVGDLDYTNADKRHINAFPLHYGWGPPHHRSATSMGSELCEAAGVPRAVVVVVAEAQLPPPPPPLLLLLPPLAQIVRGTCRDQSALRP